MRKKLAIYLCIILWVALAGILIWQFDTHNPYEKTNEFAISDLGGCDGRIVVMFGKSADQPPDILYVYHNHKLVCYFYHIGDDYFVVRNGEVKKTTAETIGAFLDYFTAPCKALKQKS